MILDCEFMLVSMPDEHESFKINGDRMTPGISVSNSEVGLAALSISTFTLRLVCANGMISKTAVSASYRHVSSKLLSTLPGVLNGLKAGFGEQEVAVLNLTVGQGGESRDDYREFHSPIRTPEGGEASCGVSPCAGIRVYYVLGGQYIYQGIAIRVTRQRAGSGCKKVGGMVLGMAH
jgi:hypothetical protein